MRKVQSVQDYTLHLAFRIWFRYPPGIHPAFRADLF
jgi:hypothetical protein